MIYTVWVALGGAIGSAARYWLTLLAAPLSTALPLGTLAINIGGSFVIAFFGTLTLEAGRHPAPEWARLFVMTGLCGGFTTFSSFSLDTIQLLQRGALGRALANIGLSVLRCLASVFIGHTAASRLNSGARPISQSPAEEET